MLPWKNFRLAREITLHKTHIMKPCAAETELPISIQLRKVIFGGSSSNPVSLSRAGSRTSLSLIVATAVVFVLCGTAAAQLSEMGRDDMLKKYAPVFTPDSGDEIAICDSADYLNGCRILNTEGGNRWLKSPDGDEMWSSLELTTKLKEGNSIQEQSSKWETSPRPGVRDQRQNTRKRANGAGVFGHVRHLTGEFYSVKYFLFLAWNETAYDGGEGNHEGDWLCADFQVRVPAADGRPDLSKALLEYALLHNHGRVLLVGSANLDKTSDGRPQMYLERGTNEPWPNKGKRGFEGWPDGLRVTKNFGGGKGPSSEHKVVREHEGKGVPYDTKGKVQNLETSKTDSVWLVLNYRGQWGERDDDKWKAITGYDATNPHSPRWNSKMWERSFTDKRDDPASDGIWQGKPK